MTTPGSPVPPPQTSKTVRDSIAPIIAKLGVFLLSYTYGSVRTPRRGRAEAGGCLFVGVFFALRVVGGQVTTLLVTWCGSFVHPQRHLAILQKGTSAMRVGSNKRQRTQEDNRVPIRVVSSVFQGALFNISPRLSANGVRRLRHGPAQHTKAIMAGCGDDVFADQVLHANRTRRLQRRASVRVRVRHRQQAIIRHIPHARNRHVFSVE